MMRLPQRKFCVPNLESLVNILHLYPPIVLHDSLALAFPVGSQGLGGFGFGMWHKALLLLPLTSPPPADGGTNATTQREQHRLLQQQLALSAPPPNSRFTTSSSVPRRVAVLSAAKGHTWQTWTKRTRMTRRSRVLRERWTAAWEASKTAFRGRRASAGCLAGAISSPMETASGTGGGNTWGTVRGGAQIEVGCYNA